VLGRDGTLINIIDTPAPNIYLFSNRVLEKIFTIEEIINGSVKPTGRGGCAALKKSKIDKLKGAIQSRFNIATADFIAVWRDVKERLNNKCKDTRRKHAKIVK
jgi:hypothetical protein